jgi:hypothetical protein
MCKDQPLENHKTITGIFRIGNEKSCSLGKVIADGISNQPVMVAFFILKRLD